MIKHKQSHLDHGLNGDQIAYILERFADRRAFFIETIELPAELGEGISCGLHGPEMGDEPVSDAECYQFDRGRRTQVEDGSWVSWTSRVCEREERKTRMVTVIAGPHVDRDDDGKVTAEFPCVLYTCYGGPAAPREPGDPDIASDAERETSKAFWAEHALTRPGLHEATVTKLASGIKIANFSSAHAFTFDDGTVLAACSKVRCKALMLHSVEVEHANPGGWTDIELRFEMSEQVREAVQELQAREDLDIILVPFPVMNALKGAGLPVGKCRTVRMKDRVTKTAFSDRFCC